MYKSVSIFALLFLVVGANAQDFSNKKIKLGQKAPELAYADPSGKILKLSEINKGRVVLLDFWASWCRPCRISNPGLVRLYKDFKDKSFKDAPNGFTIVSVSLDENPGMWRLALQADSLNWAYHMADPAHRGQGPAESYGVEYIPQAFVIGADGKIKGKYMTAEEAIPTLKAMLKE